MDRLVTNQGLAHVALCIFAYLDFDGIQNCALVSKSWRHLILNSSTLWYITFLKFKIKIIRKIETKLVTLKSFNSKNIFCELKLKFDTCFPEWRKMIEIFEAEKCPKTQRKFLILLKNYFESVVIRSSQNQIICTRNWIHPINLAIKKGKLSYVKLLMPYLEFNTQRHSLTMNLKQTVLEVACQEGQIAIINYLLDYAQDHGIDINESYEGHFTLLRLCKAKGWNTGTDLLVQRARGHIRKRQIGDSDVIQID